MAPKEVIDNPPMASSSEEEDEESGSSGEESGSSGEESGESSGDEIDDQSTKPIVVPVPAASKKPEEAESESESESDSDPEPEPAKTKAVVVTKPRLEIPGSITKSSVPESSKTAKRSLKQTEDDGDEDEDEDEVKKKKMKTEVVKKQEEEVSKKQMFQRLFSENDEIALLQGILDFTSTKGDPSEQMDVFYDYSKKLINFDASKSQLVTKVRRLKKKFVTMVQSALDKGKSEDDIVYPKDLDQKVFELSRKIWGNNGVLASSSRSRKKSKEVKLSHSTKKVVEVKNKPKAANVVSTSSIPRFSSVRGGEMAAFFKAQNVTAFGLDEFTVSAGWDMVADGQKKREMEERLKKIKVSQEELCLQRAALAAETAKMIFKEIASSSSGK